MRQDAGRRTRYRRRRFLVRGWRHVGGGREGLKTLWSSLVCVCCCPECRGPPCSHFLHPFLRPAEGGSGAFGCGGDASRGRRGTPAQPHSPIAPAPASTTPACRRGPDKRSRRAARHRCRHAAACRRRPLRLGFAAHCRPEGGVGSRSGGKGSSHPTRQLPPTAAAADLAASRRDGRRSAHGLIAADGGHRPASARCRRRLDRDAAKRRRTHRSGTARPRAATQPLPLSFVAFAGVEATKVPALGDPLPRPSYASNRGAATT